MVIRKSRKAGARQEAQPSVRVSRPAAKGNDRFLTRMAAAILVAVALPMLLASSIHETVDGASPNNTTTATRIGSHFSGDGTAPARPSGDLSISLNGANPLQEECGDPFSDPGATATNGAGKAVPVQVSGEVDSRTPGSYTLRYSANEQRDSTSIERVVNVVDTTPPEISLEGGNTTTIFCSATFVEPGSSASDRCQGSVPVTISGAVDSLPGTYTVSYTATDARNNTRTVTRKVIVGGSDMDPPTVTLNGHAELTIECGSNFTDPGATATAACAGPLPVNTSGAIEVNAPGSYNLIYSATDNELTSQASRVIAVVDTTAPLISLIGDSPLTIVRGSNFTDPGATAQDGCAGDFAATASSKVDPNAIGSYTITYTASDPSGNQATPVKRTVNVVEAPPPTAAIPNPLWLIAVVLVSKVSSLGGF